MASRILLAVDFLEFLLLLLTLHYGINLLTIYILVHPFMVKTWVVYVWLGLVAYLSSCNRHNVSVYGMN